MLTFGSSTFYKMVMKPDGSPNWVGIGILTSTAVGIFLWRCLVIATESEVAVRLRFGSVATDMKVTQEIKGFNQFLGAREYQKGPHMRLYSVHSLVKVNCADRRTALGNKTVTLFDRDHEIAPTALWRVSRDRGCPSKSLFNVQDTSLKDKESDELEAIVRDMVDDALVRAYARLEEGVKPVVPTLPVLTVEEHLQDVVKELYIRYGVELRQLLYGQRAVAAAQRGKEGNLAIAESNKLIAEAQNNMAAAIGSLDLPIRLPTDDERASA